MRIEKRINQDWKFILPGQEVEKVCLPHTVKLTPANSSGCLNYQGKCEYRKNLFIGSECSNSKIFIEFEGAMGKSQLYINGTFAGEHFCGYIPFVADITDFVRCGEDNDILMMLDNSDCSDFPPGKPQDLLDFSYDGGLYRDASLVITDKVYITNPLLADCVAGGGIFVHYENITKESATLCVKTHIKNEKGSSKNVKLVHILKDMDSSEVGKTEEMVTVEDEMHYESTLEVAHPKLWSMDTPYLYTLETSIYIDGVLVDSVATQTGIRTLEFTLTDGVIFNGENMRIIGANYHQTYPYIGNGVPNNLLKRDILKLKDAGMKNIRSHYPFSLEFVKYCNEIGMSLIVSNVGWQFFKDGLFFERACKNMRDIIRWQRNNPSIIIWEPILNESTINAANQRLLADLVHEENPYEYCFTASDYGPTDIAYREYDPTMLGTWREEYGLIEKEDVPPQLPLWIREYGDFPDDFVQQNAIWRTPRAFGDYAMVQAVERMIGRYEATTEGSYIDVYKRKDICGYGVWPGIEHNRGYHINPCWGGYFDLFRVPKFTYHFIKSQQDREKIGDYIFIANFWSETSPGDVCVYSNAQKVRLYHDDVLVGEQDPDDVEVAHPPFTFKDVRRKYKTRARATLRAEAIVDGTVVAKTTVKSPGVACKLQLDADLMNIPLVADGSDIVVVHCNVLDADGSIVPQTADNHPLVFEIEGPGEIIGDSSIRANPICPEGGIATVLVRAKQEPGDIIVKVNTLWKHAERIAIQGDQITIKTE